MSEKDDRPNSEETRPILDGDQTNGIVEGLDGDDGGAIEPDEQQGNPVTGMAATLGQRLNAKRSEDSDDTTGPTNYSEEGHR